MPRVRLNAAGHVELKRRTPWHDDTTHLVMMPLEFLQRLAAPVEVPGDATEHFPRLSHHQKVKPSATHHLPSGSRPGANDFAHEVANAAHERA